MKKIKALVLYENKVANDQNLFCIVRCRLVGCSHFYPKYFSFPSPSLHYKLEKFLRDLQPIDFELVAIDNKGKLMV